jgi:chemosensory pili system protein ChpC
MPSSRWSIAAAPWRDNRMSELRDELYSLLVPLAGERLIVPRTCVAEVVSYQVPSEMTNAPPWYIGVLNWSGSSVPIVSFEAAFGQALPTVSNRTRIVMFHASTDKLRSGFFGMLTQGFPQLVRVNAEVIRPDPSRSFGERSPVICQVRMVNETPLIPDLGRLEEMIAEETSVTLQRS